MNNLKSSKKINTRAVEDQQNAKANQLFALSDELEKISKKLQLIALDLVPMPDMDDEEIKRLLDAFEKEMLQEDADMDFEPESVVSRTKLTSANAAVFKAFSQLKKGV